MRTERLRIKCTNRRVRVDSVSESSSNQSSTSSAESVLQERRQRFFDLVRVRRDGQAVVQLPLNLLELVLRLRVGLAAGPLQVGPRRVFEREQRGQNLRGVQSIRLVRVSFAQT